MAFAQIALKALIRSAFNGPPIVGIGGTTDQGLTQASYHVVPYSVTRFATVTVASDSKMVRAEATSSGSSASSDGNDIPWEITGDRVDRVVQTVRHKTIGPDGNEIDEETSDIQFVTRHNAELGSTDFEGPLVSEIRKSVRYNVEQILGFTGLAAQFNITDQEFMGHVLGDVCAILAMLQTYNLYKGEVKSASSVPAFEAYKETIASNDWDKIFNADAINRALTFIAARVHTKYQTNHAMGGAVAQGAMASCIRAYYSLSKNRHSTDEERRKYDFLYKCLYWALHPVNEAYMMVQLLDRHRLSSFRIHRDGCAPELFLLAEHLQIRSGMTAAGTHYFAAGVAGIIRLKDFGLLAFLPNPGRLTTLALGYRQAQYYAAQCHPAANYWGVKRVTLSQRQVEDVVTDIGYAVRILFPGDTLATAPAFQKENGLSMSWKTFIDGVKSQMDAAVAESVKPEMMRKVLPTLTAGSADFAPNVVSALLDSPLEDVLDDGKIRDDVVAGFNAALSAHAQQVGLPGSR